MTDYLGCKNCPHVIEVSDEDQDASLSDAVTHQAVRHGVYDWQVAMKSITEVTR